MGNIDKMACFDCSSNAIGKSEDRVATTGTGGWDGGGLGPNGGRGRSARDASLRNVAETSARRALLLRHFLTDERFHFSFAELQDVVPQVFEVNGNLVIDGRRFAFRGGRFGC